MNKVRAVLFDLDGTLLDTAPDLGYALNQLRIKHGLPELPLTDIRPTVSHGIRAMLKLGFNIDDPNNSDFAQLSKEFLDIYQIHATNATALFPDMEKVLEHLEQHNIPWGIVTNKQSRFTFDILKNLNLECRAACIVCGDTLAKAKPHPEPIWHACKLLQREVSESIFIGDSLVDITAGKAAGMLSLVALYGYVSPEEDPFTWQADGYIREPMDICKWITSTL